jgi:hypothetical protein
LSPRSTRRSPHDGGRGSGLPMRVAQSLNSRLEANGMASPTSRDLDTQRPEPGKRPVEERDGSRFALVAQDLDVSQPRGIIDGDVRELPEVIRLTVLMYVRYPLSLRQSRICCSSGGSISVTRRCGSGGTGSVRCSPRRSASGGFKTGHTRTGVGTWTRCLSGSMARHTISGAPWTTKGGARGVCHTRWPDPRAALRFLKQAMEFYGRPSTIVTDRLPSYGAAMRPSASWRVSAYDRVE